MPWNSIWPNGAVSVRANNPTGVQNTAYIETTQKKDHFFNENATTDGYHKKVSMPNFGSNPAPPAGTDGVYYVFTNGSNKEARYTADGSLIWRLNIWNTQLRGTFTSGALNANFTIVSGLPTNVMGEIFIYKRNASPFLVMQGQFASDNVAFPNNTIHGFTSQIYVESSSISNRPIILLNDPSVKNSIRAYANDSTYANVEYEYLINYVSV
jgi:hypothetical protein